MCLKSDEVDFFGACDLDETFCLEGVKSGGTGLGLTSRLWVFGLSVRFHQSLANDSSHPLLDIMKMLSIGFEFLVFGSNYG